MGYNDRGPRRDSNFGNRGNRFDRGPVEKHKAICSECGAECEVPFNPTKGKPVYCNGCFQKHKPQRY